MNCADYRGILSELSRRECVEARAEREALEHRRVCRACETYQRAEETVTLGLREWGAEPATASPDVWNSLSEEFEAHNALRRRHRPWRVAAAVLVASLAVTAWLSRPLLAPAPPPPAAAWKAPSAPALAVRAEAVAPAAQIAATKAPVRRIRTRPASRLEPVPEEIATEFLPVAPPSTWSTDEGRLLRVRLPHAALATYGLPVNPERMSESVRADVMVGADGTVRAIRFIQ